MTNHTAAQPLDLDNRDADIFSAADLDEIEAIAAAAPKCWYGTYQIVDGISDENAVALIEACSPDTILTLIAQARAAQPESATGTTGAVQLTDKELSDPEYMRGYVESCSESFSDAMKTISDLRAQLAATGHGESIGCGGTGKSSDTMPCLGCDACPDRAPASAQPADKWHEAVLAECMRVESCYHANDPVKTIKELIDWHAQEASGVAEGTEILARNYIELTCASAQPDRGAVQADYRVYDEACNLAKAIHAQHYRDDSPNWRVLPDLRGVISQISNMVAGMTRTDHVYRLTAPAAVAPSDAKGKADAANAGGLTEEQQAWEQFKAIYGENTQRHPNADWRGFRRGWQVAIAQSAAASAADAKDAERWRDADDLPPDHTPVLAELKPRRKNMKPIFAVVSYFRTQKGVHDAEPGWFERFTDDTADVVRWQPIRAAIAAQQAKPSAKEWGAMAAAPSSAAGKKGGDRG